MANGVSGVTNQSISKHCCQWTAFFYDATLKKTEILIEYCASYANYKRMFWGWCMIVMIFNNSVSTKVSTRSRTYLKSWGHSNFQCKLHLNGASDAAAAIAIVYVVHPVTSAGTSNLPEGANLFHVKTKHSNKYVHCFCVAVVRTVRFTHNLQAFFITGIGLSRSFLSTSAATQKNVNKFTPGIYWKLWYDQTKWNEIKSIFRTSTEQLCTVKLLLRLTKNIYWKQIWIQFIKICVIKNNKNDFL